MLALRKTVLPRANYSCYSFSTRLAVPYAISSRFQRAYCSKKEVSYTDTLNLPKTSFPMRGNAKEREPGLLCQDYYKWQEENNKGSTFVLHDGPPYANGSPHIGHALNKILKDIIGRYKSLRGHRVSYIPGWDCHGLPIEIKAVEVLKKQGGEGNIHEVARNYALQQIEEQKKHFVRWGVMGDWDNPYTTMAPRYEARQIGIFLQMFKKGLIVRGTKPVYWSPSSVTALAEAELEYSDDHVSPSLYVQFALSDPTILNLKNQYSKLSLLIWTTTPWTLPANRAISMNVNAEYSIVKVKENFVIVASALLPALEAEFQVPLSVIETLSSQALVKATYQHPLNNQTFPVLHGDHVSLDSGTGLVHTAPGHGLDDFLVCQPLKIAAFAPVNDYGKFTAEAGPGLEGKFVLKEGNEEVIKQMGGLGAVIHQKKYKHRYPYDWRTKKPVIVRATSQWFADLSSIKDRVVQSLDDHQVSFSPSHSKKRLSSMIMGRNDWCISRQRVWGVPIPVFYHLETNEELLTDETIQHIQTLFAEHGSGYWWKSSVEELLPQNLKHKAHLYRKGGDTMDVWFDSGSSWDCVINERGLPTANVYLEGSDQHRGWFQSSLITSVAVADRPPFSQLITHGFVLDGEGRKMSKSLGNVVDPQIVIEGGKIGKTQFEGCGVDPLRFWVASLDYSGDVSISAELMEEMAGHVKKLRNTTRFLLGNLDGAENDGPISYDELLDLDKYMLHKLQQFINEMTTHYDNNAFSKVVALLLKFGNVELSSFYFDIIKDRLYTAPTNSLHRRSARYVLNQILCGFTSAMSPVLCHIAEDIFSHSTLSQQNGNVSSIFKCGWFQGNSSWLNDEVADRYENQKHGLRTLKTSFNVSWDTFKKSSDLDIRTTHDVELQINSPQLYALRQSMGQQVEELFMASKVSWNAQDSSDAGVSLNISAATTPKCPRCWKKVNSIDNFFCDKERCPQHH